MVCVPGTTQTMGLDTVIIPWHVISFWVFFFFLCTITNQDLEAFDLLFSEGYGDHRLEHETDLL